MRQPLGLHDIETVKRVMEYCRRFDVESKVHGIFDARSAAINIYSRPWTDSAERHNSYLVGTIWIEWHNGAIDIEEVSDKSLVKDIFQYLYDSAVAKDLKRFKFRDDPYWMYKDRLEEAEPVLKEAEEARLNVRSS